MPATNILELATREKPHVTVIYAAKPNNLRKQTELDNTILGWWMHPVNLDLNMVRGIVIYTQSSIETCLIQNSPDIKFSEVCLREIPLYEEDNLPFGCFYITPAPSSTSEENNAYSNNLFRFVSGKIYSHQWFAVHVNLKKHELVNADYST